MFKRWFCLALALVMAWASLSLAEEIAVPNDAVILEEGEDELIIEELPEDIEIDPLGDLDLDLAQTGDLLSEAQPDDEAAPEQGSADANEAEPHLSLSATKLLIGVKEKCTILKATRVPADSNDTVTWSSSKTSVAKVDKKTGKITGVKKGTAVITAKAASGLSAKCTVVVRKAPGKVTLTPETLTLSAGSSYALTAKLPSSTGSTLTFTSADKKVATVDKLTGVITAVAPGTTKITVKTFNSKKATCTLTVVAEPNEVFLPETLTVCLNEKTSVTATAVDANGAEVPATFTFSAEQGTGQIAVSSKTGRVGGKALGTARIRVSTQNGVSTHISGGMHVDTVCEVTVVATRDRVELATGEVSIGVDQSYDLDPRMVAEDGTPLEGVTYTVSSSDESVVTVVENGVVKGLKQGSAVVTVKGSNGAEASCVVTVVDPATLLTVSPASIVGKLSDGGAQLAWRFGTSNVDQAVRFTSADTAVVTVSASGYVTFVGVGATKVTVEAADGQKVGVSVTVEADPVDEVAYRLFAAYSYYDSLPFVKRNANGMATVFKKSSIDGQTYSTKVLGNPSKSSILSGISSFFGDADDNDVSIVYLCSHGHNNKSSYSSYRLSLMGYDSDKTNTKYYLTSKEIFNSVQAIKGNVILILDSCYSGTFINDMKSKLDGANGRIAVLTAASNTRATYYNNSSKAVDFFTFFLLQGLGYNEKESWWNKNSAGEKGSYPGYFSADIKGNGDGVATLGEFYNFASNCIEANIPRYMKKSWYWGDKTQVQKTRFYAGNLKNLVIYQPK